MSERRLGSYILTEALPRRGAFAREVAHHEERGRRVVVWLREFDNAAEAVAVRERFSELGKLSPYVAPVALDVAVVSPRHGYVFEARDTVSLRQVLDEAKTRGGLQPGEVLALSRGICASLAEWHQQGLVHGCLCPEHLEISERGDVLAQGGLLLPGLIARESPEIGRESRYRAPEVIMDEPFDERADVFALALMVAEAEHGEHPFAGEGEADLVRKIRLAESPRLGSRLQGFERVLSRALEKQPSLRPRNAGRLLADLEAASDGKLPAHSAEIAGILGRLGLGAARSQQRRESVLRVAGHRLQMAGLLAAMVAVMAGIGGSATPRTPQPLSTGKSHGAIRVLAKPWAEVSVNGELVDVTPLPGPLEVAPGRYEVLLKHPKAAPERRTVDVIAGELVVVDVQMSIIAAPDAGSPEDP